MFSGILRRGKNGNPYKKDDDESEAYEQLLNIEVCSLENMPVAEKKKGKGTKEENVKLRI